MKLVAVEGMTLDFGDTIPGEVELGSASETVSVEGSGVYAGPVTIVLVGASNEKESATRGTNKPPAGVPGVFEPTAEFCKADGLKVLRVGDKATFKVSGVDAKANPVVWDVTATIVEAGQGTLKAG